jgi:ABC-type transport system involved in multi-copper enzyme maturation permease subunit
MNTFIVTRLILKDWYLNRALLVAAIVTGLLTLAAVAAARGTTIALILGIIVLVTILIGMGAVIMSSMVNERKQQTLPFVMSLPVSYLEYTTSKVVGSLLIFSVLWLALFLGVIATILTTPWVSHGSIPFVVIMLVEILMSTCLIAAVSITTESQGWTIGVTQIGGLALNAIGFSIVRLPGIGNTIRSHTIQWSRTSILLLLIEFGAIALMIGIAFFIQSRKRDFI